MQSWDLLTAASVDAKWLLPGCLGNLSCTQDLLGALSAVLAKPAQSEEPPGQHGRYGATAGACPWGCW